MMNKYRTIISVFLMTMLTACAGYNKTAPQKYEPDGSIYKNVQDTNRNAAARSTAVSAAAAAQKK